MEIKILILLPLIGAILTAIFNKKRKIVLTLFITISLALTYILFTLYGRWDLTLNYPLNINYLGGNISVGLKVNPLGWFFSFFSMTITFLIALFSFSYNDEKHDSNTISLWLILLMANSGIFFANDFLMLFVMWEIMGISSYFIIAHGKKISEKAAKSYMALSLVGTAAMLFAILLIGNVTKSFDLVIDINYLISSAAKNSFSLFILVLLLITFLIKSAIFPFYMWPSRAYAEAPDDFTPFLSTVMSKYGIYGLALIILPVIQNGGFSPLGKVNQPAYLLAVLGAITAVLGTILAMFQTDFKKLFAYSSVSNIGYIVMGLSTMSLTGVQGALFHSVNHMVFKTAIFLSLAAVIYRTGERDMHKLGGLVYRMPFTFMTYLLAIIAAAGIPPLNGFPSKWLILQSLMSKRMVFIVIAMIFASTGSFMYLLRVLASVFLGQLPDEYKGIKEAPTMMLVPMGILMAAMIVIGVLPGTVLRLMNPALDFLGFKTEAVSLTTMTSTLKNSNLNVTYIFYIFLAGVVVSVILYLISGKAKSIPQEDNYTAGEDPAQWGTTPDRFNFSYGFYQPFKEMFIPIFDKVSFTRWLGYFDDNVKRLSLTFRKLYLRLDSSLMLLSLGVLVLVIGGILL